MKTKAELTKEYENSYPMPTKGTKVMAALMLFIIFSGVMLFICGIYFVIYLILKMI
jgi:hypothetical protein